MSEEAPSVAAKLTGSVMIAAGVAIAVVFGGGLAVFLWVDVTNLIAGKTNATGLMSTVLIGPLVGLAPALLGLVLARNGWRRWSPLPEIADEEDAP